MSSEVKALLVVLGTFLLGGLIPIIAILLGVYFVYALIAVGLTSLAYFYYNTLVEHFDREEVLRKYLNDI